MDDSLDRRQIMVYSHIYDQKMKMVLPAKKVDTATSAGEVDHLLPGNLTRGSTDTFMLYAVVAAEKKMAGMAEAWGQRVLYEADLQGQVFKESHGSFGLVQVVYFCLEGSS
ncbi:hypothetical protein LPYR103PRE_04690 [Segatella asaccharophila]|jgi:hypothetical protein